MLFKINTSSDTPLSKQIIAQITSAIRLGQLKGGDVLPSVRGLAKELHINPSTVSKAYKSLIDQKILVSKSGLGIYINEELKKLHPQKGQTLLPDQIEEFVERLISKGYAKGEIKKLFLDILKKYKDIS